ncbi:P-loop containing nucleoside triphosphate hydrolase protein [Tribonema minus]|uniref:P-loop containing nucleoside triphosphate hydrolase protein n=1 Tax=Tribonema minus TaxID=303371 RepID=A0A835YR54_9STRA|nr:P-loop containing nucleoside triphosphate hydrolase protein [Tribonema minus]
MAMEVAQALEAERGRTQRAEAERIAAETAAAAEQAQKVLRTSLRAAEERSTELEAEARTLREAMQSATSSVTQEHLQELTRAQEHLQELTRAQGDLDIARVRLAALEADRLSERQRLEAAVAELDGKVRDGEVQRRKLHNLVQELRGNVRVYARVRPFLPDDQAPAGAAPAISARGDGVSCVIVKRDAQRGGDGGSGAVVKTDTFAFDRVFPPSAGQEAVFAEVSEFVQSALDGYNVCLFSYGQTGSGKTHTVVGSGAGPMRGIIPRAMEQVGRYKCSLEKQGWAYKMSASFLEIYNEQRAPGAANDASYDARHEIKHDTRSGSMSPVTDLTLLPLDPTDTGEVERILELAARHRAVGCTSMNARSSRSHSVFTLYMRASNAAAGSALRGALHLVDLAGSERLDRSGATGQRLKETQAINKSLSALTDVFTALANKTAHVPFRNSKLTYLLQPALSGEGKTLMMVNLSPTDDSYSESLCSLRFASQVNQCELGRAKRNIRDASATIDDGASTCSSSSSVASLPPRSTIHRKTSSR